MKEQAVQKFQKTVWGYYHEHGRDLPWRYPVVKGQIDPYKVMVSEIMLQQTQVKRVVPKYQEFMELFPTLQDLAAAPLARVLTAWSGLGYNRRAKFLWQAVRQIVSEHDGHFPESLEALVKLPGIGKNTAAAILVYAFNQPHSFIETNIRSVFIRHFFKPEETVDDKDLLPIIAAVQDNSNPREWYWALMDYGSYIKATEGNYGRASRHYTKQSRFKGSRREIRGAVLRLLGAGSLTFVQLEQQIPDERLTSVITDLLAEQLISQRDEKYLLYTI